MSPRTPETLKFLYRFKLNDGVTKEFPVVLDGRTLNIIRSDADADLPDWTRLSYHQCTNCPLKEAEHPRCPVAVNLVGLMDAFSDRLSYETVEVEIDGPSRRNSKTVPLAEGIRSLMGLIMAASGCPVLDRLKPLVRTHLPFSAWDETSFRVIGTYLIAQYFIAKRGGKPDWELEHLAEFYAQIKILNINFCQRLRSFCLQDAPINAVAELDSLADMTTMLIQKERIKSLEQTLAPYFESLGDGPSKA